MLKKMMLAGTAAAGLMIAAPAMAQTTGGATTGTISDNSDENTIVNDVLDAFAVDNGPDTTTVSLTASSANQNNNNSKSMNMVIADQYLKAMNINRELDEVVDLDGEDGTETAVGYNSGSQSVNDNAFAAFAGISNAAWNSGINANTQAATNIAALGTVNFGVTGSAGTGGGGGGDAD